jgi:hypothetical protein
MHSVNVAADLDAQSSSADKRGMTTWDVRQRLQGGFVPFKLRTSDGCEFNVPHREFIFVTERRVVVATPDGYVNVLDPLHIVSLEEAKPLPMG